jgi:4'-phosphopantetheinyl transferase
MKAFFSRFDTATRASYDPRVASVVSEVQVWQVWLDRPPEEVTFLQSLLSPEEMRRADAFHFEKDRRRYTVARGALRSILAKCLSTAPEDLQFRSGPQGKPYLGGGPGFNLSHCEDLALIAVAEDDRAVGVDVERVLPLKELGSIEERYFSPEERALLAAAAAAERQRVFVTLWTRREAAAKALGQDLQAALAGIRLPAYAPGGTALVELEGGGPWFLSDLSLDADHLGALCVRGEHIRISLGFYSP